MNIYHGDVFLHFWISDFISIIYASPFLNIYLRKLCLALKFWRDVGKTTSVTPKNGHQCMLSPTM
jgi:hypothetical protein